MFCRIGVLCIKSAHGLQNGVYYYMLCKEGGATWVHALHSIIYKCMSGNSCYRLIVLFSVYQLYLCNYEYCPLHFFTTAHENMSHMHTN